MMASYNLNVNSSLQSQDIQRLSTGLRINSAADDPAGLVRAQQMTAQLSGLKQASRNVNDAINLTKTAEAALNETHNLLMSMRQLAVQASNAGTNDSSALAADQAQIASAIKSINRIASTTLFGTKHLLDGSATSATTTTGGDTATASNSGLEVVNPGSWTSSNAGAYTSATAAAATPTTYNVSMNGDPRGGSYSGSIIINGQTYAVGSHVSMATVNATIAPSGYQMSETANSLVGTAITPGAGPTPTATIAGFFCYTASAASIHATGFSITQGTDASLTLNGGVNSGYKSTSSVDNGDGTRDYTFSNGAVIKATGTAGTINTGLSTTASVSSKGTDLMFQIGANSGETEKLSIQSTGADQLGRNASTYKDASGATQTVNTSSISAIDVTTFKGAQDAIAVIDKAIADVSTTRAKLGAFQTYTLQSSATSLAITQENLSSSISSIMDADLAETIVQYTKHQIMVQASTTALMYANQQSQAVLKLLQ
jgi:flagellin